MKKSKLYIIGLLGLAFAFSGCESENLGFDEGEATLVIEPEISTEITTSPISRAAEDAVDQENLMHKLNVVVSTPKGNAICYWNSSTGFPWKDDTESAMEYKLNSGSYIVEGWTGDSIAASWTRRYFKGKQNVTLKPGTRTSVRLTCKIVNTAVEVKYSDQIDDVLSHYTLVVTTASTSLNFEGREERTGYFMLPTKSHDMDWVFNGIRKDGTNIHMHGTIKDAKASTKYSFRIKYEDPGVQYGGSAIKIDVDESTMDVEHEVQFRTRPEVMRCSEEGLFDIGEEMPYPATAEKVGDIELLARSSGRITSVDLEMQGVESLLPELTGSVNIYGGTDAQSNRSKLEAAGIRCEYVDDQSNGVTSFPIYFLSTLTDRLPEGNYRFTLNVTDESYTAGSDRDVKNMSKTFVLVVTSDKAIAVKPSNDETISLFESEIRLVGQVTEEGVNEVGFYYRAAGSDTPWENARYVGGTASLPSRSFTNGSRFYATVSGLTTERKYEYVAAFDRKPAISSVVEVSTGIAPQLPNAGFEKSSGSSPLYFYGSGEEMFWDSGNKGSSTMKKNVTTLDSGKKHSGTYSLKMQSQFVGLGSIGKFAAGNIFTGEFIGTEKTYYGILGWGRPWTARPRQLRGYVHYTRGTVDYNQDGGMIATGQPDQGIIYIAMADNSSESYDGKSYPLIVRNYNANRLFSKSDANVLAYGEHVITESTPGSDMVEFTIDLDWYNLNIKPSNIIIVASASRYGDYYNGSTGSVMYLDDLELVY